MTRPIQPIEEVYKAMMAMDDPRTSTLDLVEKIVDIVLGDDFDEIHTMFLLTEIEQQRIDLYEALAELLEATDVESAATDSEPDEASVGWDDDGELAMTFGHVRRAERVLAKARGEVS